MEAHHRSRSYEPSEGCSEPRLSDPGLVGGPKAGRCVNKPTALGLGFALVVLCLMMFLVQWVEVAEAEHRHSRRAELNPDDLQKQHGGTQQPSPALSQRPVGVVLQRTVALVPFGDKGELGETRGILVRELGLGVQFDMSTDEGVIISEVDPPIAEESGLAVGDRIVSLAGVLVAADHDPLAALDEAEDAIRDQRDAARKAGEPRPAVLVVAAPNVVKAQHGATSSPRFGLAPPSQHGPG